MFEFKAIVTIINCQENFNSIPLFELKCSKLFVFEFNFNFIDQRV